MRRWVVLICVLVLGVASVQAQYNQRYISWASRNLLAEDNFKEAIEILNVLLRTDQKSHEGYYLRGYAKLGLGDMLGAEADFTRAIELNPVYTDAYHFRGIVRSEMGNYDDATRDFAEAIDLRPDLPNSYYSRGVTHLRNKQYVKAVVDFDMILRFTDKDAQTYINKGVALLNMRDTLAAYDNFDRAIRTNREYTEGYNRKATLQLEQGRYEEALENFNKAIECDSTYLQPIFNRAIVYSHLERYDEALADFDRVIALDDYVVSAYFDKAIIYAQRGEWQRAIENYNKVLEHTPDNVKAYYNRAAVYHDMGLYAAAIADYSKAIELYPDFANAYLNRALVKDMVHDNKGADNDRAIASQKIEEYEARLEANPEELSIYADTSRHFNRLVSFESQLSRDRVSAELDQPVTLRPMFRFTLLAEENGSSARYYAPALEEFLGRIEDEQIVFTNLATTLPPDSLVVVNGQYEQRAKSDLRSGMELFKYGISQLCVRQYTSSVSLLSQAILDEPANAFYYINRAVTRAEMIDFISSINSPDRIAIDSDMVLQGIGERTYNYDEAIADLNKAAKLCPSLAYIYFNRGNLHALSGDMPAAYDDYSRAIELAPQLADAYFNRGLVQIYMKDTRKGCMDLSKAGELGIKEAYAIIKRYNNIN